MAMTGVYVGNEPDHLGQFEQWLGREPAGALGYVGGGTWEDIASPGWVPSFVTNDPDDGVFWSVPLIPEDGTTTADAAPGGGANGAARAAWRSAAQQILASGTETPDGRLHVRTGWELNGTWFQWSIYNPGNSPESFAAAFRDFVDTFRAVEQEAGRAGTFKFEWNFNGLGPNDPSPAYPGDAWVDLVGIDTYYNPQFTSTNADEAWAILRDSQFGLNWARDFAIARGKQVAVSEWGVRTDQGSSDANSARLMDLFSDWLEDPANLVVQHTYWDHDTAFPGRLSDGSDPLTGAEYREQFSDPDVLLGDYPPGPMTPPPPPVGGQDLVGTPGNDVLTGGLSFDTIVGGSGDDTISGGHMSDVLTGGFGRNVFKFGTALPWGPVQNDSGGWGGTWGDTITDFRQGWDKIDVSALFTFATREGVRDTAAFTFVGQDAFSGTRPELRYEWLPDGTTRIQMDGDLDLGNKTDVGGRPDGAILLLGHHELDVQDFIL